MLSRLDVVVGSVHSALRSESRPMTVRMVTALANPHLDILGHCTGRMRTGRRSRPESAFDADIVFAAAARFDKAIEINSRPERLDPPKRLLRLAVEAGCRVAIDSDAHTPGQLFWQRNGCERAFLCGVHAGDDRQRHAPPTSSSPGRPRTRPDPIAARFLHRSASVATHLTATTPIEGG